jgi:radical SAM superfamily enzyme YgiQ (UPF0313 family)
MYKISFINPNFQQGPKEFNAYYLPYSAGVLWSYAEQFPNIKEKFTLGEFIWRRDMLDDAVEKLKDSDILAFSTYIWNKSYNYVLAKRLKELNPKCLILFGGPEPPIEKPDIFELYPFIDIAVKQEGEETFRDILDHYEQGNFEDVPGLLINKDNKVFETAKRERIDDIDIIPSPYLTGVFDKLMAGNPDVEWNAVIESNRGCPYQCTFCDWGSLTYNKVKKFNLERVLDELEWIGRNKVGFISIADANFGIFPDRDNVIADKLIEIQQNYGFPNAYTISWAKNQKKEIIEIVKRLVNNGARMGLTVSVQSLDDNVLEVIKRKNMGINQIEDIFERCDKENIPVITELILGLPGETLTSWKENYYRLFRANNHTGITTYNAQILENAEMNLSQRKFYKIESTVVKDYLNGTNNEGDLEEGVEIVKSTRDMPYESLLDALMFTWFMNTFHINGLSNVLSRFAYKHDNIDYKDFYEDLYTYLLEDEWFNQQVVETRAYYNEWFTNGYFKHPKIGSTDVTGMNLGQRTSIAIHADMQYNNVFRILETYYRNRFSNHEKYIDDLFTVQKNYFIRYDEIKNYPKTVVIKNNILGYIQNNDELESSTEYFFEFYEDKNMSISRFCESLWFGRRRNFGKAYVSYKKEQE